MELSYSFNEAFLSPRNSNTRFHRAFKCGKTFQVSFYTAYPVLVNLIVKLAYAKQHFTKSSEVLYIISGKIKTSAGIASLCNHFINIEAG